MEYLERRECEYDQKSYVDFYMEGATLKPTFGVRILSPLSSSPPPLPCPINFGLPDFLENIQTKKFVLIRGEGFGAWCWYKSISMLEEAGLLPSALDLTGSGIDQTDPNSVTTLAAYSKPLIDYLHDLPEDEKVILVGHSCGGASISYALEHCPKKVSKAVFVSATMVSDGQKPFDLFTEEGEADCPFYIKTGRLTPDAYGPTG